MVYGIEDTFLAQPMKKKKQQQQHRHHHHHHHTCLTYLPCANSCRFIFSFCRSSFRKVNEHLAYLFVFLLHRVLAESGFL